MNDTHTSVTESDLAALRALLGESSQRATMQLMGSRVASEAATIRELRSWMRTATAMIYHGSIGRFHGSLIARVTFEPGAAPHSPVAGSHVSLHVQLPGMGQEDTARLNNASMSSWTLYWLDETYSAVHVEGVDGDPMHDPAGTVRINPNTGQPVTRTVTGHWVYGDSHTPTLGMATSVVRGWQVAYRPNRRM